MPTTKIIQIAVDATNQLVCLCADGSVWVMIFGGNKVTWRLLTKMDDKQATYI